MLVEPGSTWYCLNSIRWCVRVPGRCLHGVSTHQDMQLLLVSFPTPTPLPPSLLSSLLTLVIISLYATGQIYPFPSHHTSFLVHNCFLYPKPTARLTPADLGIPREISLWSFSEHSTSAPRPTLGQNPAWASTFFPLAHWLPRHTMAWVFAFSLHLSEHLQKSND